MMLRVCVVGNTPIKPLEVSLYRPDRSGPVSNFRAAQRRRRTNYIGKVEYLRFWYRPWCLDVVTRQNAAGEMEVDGAGGMDRE